MLASPRSGPHIVRVDTITVYRRDRATKGQPTMAFDWAEAARRIALARPTLAEAGLAGDFGYTGGAVWRDGALVPRARSSVALPLASTHLVPALRLDGGAEDPCYVVLAPGSVVSADYWPAAAGALLP